MLLLLINTSVKWAGFTIETNHVKRGDVDLKRGDVDVKRGDVDLNFTEDYL